MVNDWYRSSEMLPPVGVVVRVMWLNDEFDAVRMTRKRAGGRHTAVSWATMDDRRVVYLPADGLEHVWGHDPRLWRPIDPSAWTHQLPIPVQADGSRPDAGVVLRFAPHHREWWRDAHMVSYSPCGAVTPREAEGRVMRALMVEQSMPAEKLGGGMSVLARMITIVEMAEGKRPSYWHDRMRPSARDLSDMTVVIPWLTALTDRPKLYGLLRLRAVDPAYSWQAISEMDEYHCSRENVRAMYKAALTIVTRVANGQSTPQTVAAARQMASLKERNRCHALR